MARRRKSQKSEESSLLDVLDHVLNKGAVVNGDVVLGVANVDLIYVKLSVLLAAFDKVMKQQPALPPVPPGPKKRRRR
ncbi:MAG: gas vesicle protein [Vicinamibacterales bacterium]